MGILVPTWWLRSEERAHWHAQGHDLDALQQTWPAASESSGEVQRQATFSCIGMSLIIAPSPDTEVFFLEAARKLENISS